MPTWNLSLICTCSDDAALQSSETVLCALLLVCHKCRTVVCRSFKQRLL